MTARRPAAALFRSAAAVAIAVGSASAQETPSAEPQPASPRPPATTPDVRAARRTYLDDLCRSGLALADLGRYIDAEARVRACVKADPVNPRYRRALADVSARRRRWEDELIASARWPIVEEISYRDVTLGEVLDDLQQRSRAADPTGRGFNLVYHGRSAPIRERPVRLNLREIPLDAAVRYACEVVGVRVLIRGRTVFVAAPSPSPASAPAM